MMQGIKKYLPLLKKKNISYDKIIRNPVVKEKELIKNIHKYDGLICSDDEVTKLVLEKAVNLKVISKWGTGTDSIDKIYAKKKKIKVLNSPDAFSKSVAQLVWGMILLLSRNIIKTQKIIKDGQWPKLTGSLLKDKNLGIIGLGKVGQSVIKMGSGFEMKIIGHDTKSLKKNFLKKFKVSKLSKKQLLKKSDFIVLCVDLNDSSHHLISKKELKFMKKNSVLINISRGQVVNEKDLISALKNKKIKAAGLDVFETEPLKKNNSLLKLDNCVLSSHNAFNTEEEVNKVHKNTILNLVRGLSL